MTNLTLKDEYVGNLISGKILMDGGLQYIFRFGRYGASIIKRPGSYGFEKDLWELAVLWFDGDNDKDWDIDYDTDITDDVLGYLTDEEVYNALERIKNLK